VSGAPYQALFLIAIGAFFSIHCFRAGRRELLEGRAKGIWGDHLRGSPGFWPTIGLTFATSALGVVFLIYGIVWAFVLVTGS